MAEAGALLDCDHGNAAATTGRWQQRQQRQQQQVVEPNTRQIGGAGRRGGGVAAPRGEGGVETSGPGCGGLGTAVTRGATQGAGPARAGGDRPREGGRSEWGGQRRIRGGRYRSVGGSSSLIVAHEEAAGLPGCAAHPASSPRPATLCAHPKAATPHYTQHTLTAMRGVSVSCRCASHVRRPRGTPAAGINKQGTSRHKQAHDNGA